MDSLANHLGAPRPEKRKRWGKTLVIVGALGMALAFAGCAGGSLAVNHQSTSGTNAVNDSVDIRWTSGTNGVR